MEAARVGYGYGYGYGPGTNFAVLAQPYTLALPCERVISGGPSRRRPESRLKSGSQLAVIYRTKIFAWTKCTCSVVSNQSVSARVQASEATDWKGRLRMVAEQPVA